MIARSNELKERPDAVGYEAKKERRNRVALGLHRFHHCENNACSNSEPKQKTTLSDEGSFGRSRKPCFSRFPFLSISDWEAMPVTVKLFRKPSMLANG